MNEGGGGIKAAKKPEKQQVNLKIPYVTPIKILSTER